MVTPNKPKMSSVESHSSACSYMYYVCDIIRSCLPGDVSDRGHVKCEKADIRVEKISVWCHEPLRVTSSDTPIGTLRFRGEISDNHRPVKCLISSEGKVTYYTLAIYRVSCALQLTNFPFDDHTCSLWFGSWTYNSTELDIFSPGKNPDRSAIN